MTQMNRYLPDRMMDHIDHALGRPAEPIGETYREYFAVNPDTILDREMAASPYWEAQPFAPGDGERIYLVTQAGRQALATYLRENGLQPRAFLVSVAGFTSTVWAETRAKARYEHWLNVADCFPDWDFGDFCRSASVRAA